METAHYPGKRFPAPASLLVAVALLAGCASHPVPHRATARLALPAVWPRVAPAQPDAANAVLMRALSLVGTPYTYGGNTPEAGFDCSGLVGYVFRDSLARSVPRTAAALGQAGDAIGIERMATGDLVVFGEPGAASHVGIYVGEGRFVHAPSSGGTVRLDSLDAPYWRDHLLGARRLLR